VPTVNIIFTALAGTLVLYLPGGTDTGWLSNEALLVNFTLLDFGTLLGWWGAMVAAIALAATAFGRSRLVPRWVGVFSLVMVALPVGIAVATSLQGLVGMTGPIWLVVVSIAQIFSRKINA